MFVLHNREQKQQQQRTPQKSYGRNWGAEGVPAHLHEEQSAAEVGLRTAYLKREAGYRQLKW